MEPSESDSVVSSCKDPQLGSQCEPSSPVPNHNHDPQASESDLNDKLDLKVGDETLEIDGKLHNKLNLKDGDETESKDSNFEAGGGELCAPEYELDGELHNKLNLNDGDETQNKDSNFEAGGGELCAPEYEIDGVLHNKLNLKDGNETENKDSNFEARGGELCDEDGAPESGEGQGSDDGWNGDGGYNGIENVKESDGWNGVGGYNGIESVKESDGWNGDWGYNGMENVKESDGWNGDWDVDGVESGDGAQQYPLRPEADDCAFYLKTGTCKFGFNCRFNHPVKKKNQAVKEKAGEREEPVERSGQAECKYYLRSGGCKFGNACKFNHIRGKCSAAPILELNFLGLPIRLGEKECPYYMRTGSCKFGANCKFNHPDPTAVGGSDSSLGYRNGSSISLQGVSQPSVPSWSSPRTLNETTPFVPMMLTQPPQSSDWNGYQAPVYLSESGMHPPSTYVMNNPAIETNVYMHHQKQMPVEEFPERPGEPECSFFLKTGDCKFKSNCKFHHPKNRVSRLPPCSLSDKGLPLRPNQNVCTYYSRYGLCKFGPACKYDHSINPSPSASVEVAGMGESEGANDATLQQPL